MSFAISPLQSVADLRPCTQVLVKDAVVPERVDNEESCLEYLKTDSQGGALDIARSLMPYACSAARYKELLASDADILPMNGHQQLLTYRHVASIANLMAKISSQAETEKNRYIKRKESGLDVKITIPDTPTSSFILLPRKHPTHDVCGGMKRGRVAIYCMKDDQDAKSDTKSEVSKKVWNNCLLWNLTNQKTKLTPFLQARDVEKAIAAHIPSAPVPLRYFDFNHVSNEGDVVKRSCYDARYECLIDVINKSPNLSFEAFAVGAAQAIEVFHKNDFFLGDVKVDNMLTDKDRDKVFLCDLDGAGQASAPEKTRVNGTLWYAAPERLRKGDIDYLKSDIFSFGCFLYYLSFFKCVPWYENGTMNKARCIPEKAKQLAELSVEAKQELLNKKATSVRHARALLSLWALHPLPQERPSITEVVAQLQEPYPQLNSFRILQYHDRLLSILNSA